MTSSSTSDAQDQSLFLRLPVELRLNIYDFAAADRTLTIGGTPGYWDTTASRKSQDDYSGAIRGQHVWVAEGYKEDLLLPDSLRSVDEAPQATVCSRNLRKRSYLADEEDAQAVAGQRVNASRARVDNDYPSDSALSVPSSDISPSADSSSSTTPTDSASELLRSSINALHLTHPQIHEELLQHRPQYDPYYRHLDLNVSWPAGVTILADHYSNMLKQVKNLNILGLNTLDEAAGMFMERKQNVKDYRWEKITLTSRDEAIPPADMLNMHQVNCLATVVARLLGRIAYEEEEDFRERQAAAKKAAESSMDVDGQDVTERRLSFSSIPREEQQPLSGSTTNDQSSGGSTPSGSDIEAASEELDLIQIPANASRPLTIDPPPDPVRARPTPSTSPRASRPPASRRRPSSPAPPLPHTPVLSVRIFHPRGPRPPPPPPQSFFPNDPIFTLDRHRDPRVPPQYPPRPRQQEPYSLVWSHVFSPITISMSNIYGGHIDLSVARAEKGVGVAAVVRGNGGLGRQVTSKWPSLERGDDGRKWIFEGPVEPPRTVASGSGSGSGSGDVLRT